MARKRAANRRSSASSVGRSGFIAKYELFDAGQKRESNRVLGEAVEVRCLAVRVAVHGKMVGPQGVDHDEENVAGLGGCGRPVAFGRSTVGRRDHTGHRDNRENRQDGDS